jgi:CRP/FNR family transcriptional regulator, cyclic AMP receptor protein
VTNSGSTVDIDSSAAGAGLLPYCADIPIVEVPAGETLIAQGAPPPAIFILVEGATAVDRDGMVFAEVDYPGAVFGEMSTVMRSAATATVRTTKTSTLHIARDPEGFLRRPDVAIAVLRLTANRLEEMTRYLAEVRGQFDQLEGQLGLVTGIPRG